MNRLGLKCAGTVLLAALVGCGSKPVAPPMQQVGSLNVVVEASTETIHVGGATILTVTAKNNTSENIDFGLGSSSCWFGVRIRDVSSGKFLSYSRICTADLRYRSLGPGEERSEGITWHGDTRVGNDYVDVPPGVYEIWGVAQDNVSPSIIVRVSN